MNQITNCLGAETPRFYMIQYQNTHTIVAMQMVDQYLFKAATKSQQTWQSVDAKIIDKMIESIDQTIVDQVKASIQSADKFAIRLLMISTQLFNTSSTIFDTLLSKLKLPKLDFSQPIHTNTFAPLHINDLKQIQSIDRTPWKLIYINKLMESRSLPLVITQWNIVICPQRYIFEDKSNCDTSIRLIQLHKAITQIQNDKQLSDGAIYQLSQTLDETISKFNFNLPDICLHFQQPTYKPVDNQKVIQQGLLLIINLARLGIVNNCAELNNIGMTNNGIAFKSYDHAILAEVHGVPFDFQQVENTLNLVYKKKQSISRDPVWVFNCLVMYDVIRLMLSIQKQNDATNSAKAAKIIIDANSIMKQVYDTKPNFDCKSQLTASIIWLYDKHFDSLLKCPQFIVSKNQDSNKYNYVSNYLYQFEFGKAE